MNRTARIFNAPTMSTSSLRPAHRALLAAALLPLVTHAQQAAPSLAASAVQQVESFQQRQAFGSPAFRTGTSRQQPAAPELYPGESADVGPQLILLETRVRPAERRTWWEAAADVQSFYTSNVFLTEKGNTDTGVLITTALAGIAPPAWEVPGGQLAVRAGYRHQRWMYGLDDTSNQLNNFDFDVSTAYLGARYVFREHWVASLGLDYNRLLSHEDDWREFYTELVPSWGLERSVPLGEKTALSLGYVGAAHFTRTDPNPTSHASDRLDSILSASLAHELLPRLIVQPFYRFQHTHYWESGARNDRFHTLGLTVAYALTDWASVRFFTSWELRDSGDPTVTDYEKFDTGGGVSMALRF